MNTCFSSFSSCYLRVSLWLSPGPVPRRENSSEMSPSPNSEMLSSESSYRDVSRLFCSYECAMINTATSVFVFPADLKPNLINYTSFRMHFVFLIFFANVDSFSLMQTLSVTKCRRDYRSSLKQTRLNEPILHTNVKPLFIDHQKLLHTLESHVRK